MTVATVGHAVNYTLVVIDTNGNPMLTQPPFDSPPKWAKVAADTVDTLAVAADGSSASVTTLAAGNDSISVTAVIGGATFSATDQLEIDAAPQVVGGVKLVAAVA